MTPAPFAPYGLLRATTRGVCTLCTLCTLRPWCGAAALESGLSSRLELLTLPGGSQALPQPLELCLDGARLLPESLCLSRIGFAHAQRRPDPRSAKALGAPESGPVIGSPAFLEAAT